MSEQTKRLYEFGRYSVNVADRLLLRDKETVALTPKVFDILLTLVESSGQVVSKEELMRKVWPETFVEEGNLTQNISILRKALGEGHNGHRYIETIARRGYRFIAPVREFEENGFDLNDKIEIEQKSLTLGGPAAVASASTVAARMSEDYARAPVEGKTARGRARWRVAVLAVAILAAAAVAIVYFTRGNTITAGGGAIESIAVLPFVNEAADRETEYFNDEITSSLINNLSQLPKLRVVPRNLVVSYKGREVDLRGVANDLNVRAVLTGRMHRRGDTLNIQVDLIDVANMSQLWGQRYDRKISDILLVQEDISRDIFENLRLKLSVEEKRQLDAFSLYLKGRNYLNKRTEDGLQQGIKYFQDAIEVDPAFAQAYAGLADCYNMLVVYGLSQPTEAFPTAKEAALKALKIDDTLAEAHTSLAFINHRYDWERAEAEREFQLAIKYKPGYAPAHQWYSSYLVALERFDEAIAEARRGQELDPLSFISSSHVGWVLYLAGRHDEAIEHCKKLLEVDPNFFPARRYLGLAYEQKGMYDKAIEEFQKGVKLSDNPLMLSLLGHAYAASGRKAEAHKVIQDLDRQKQRYVSPYMVAGIYAGLGDKDESFKWLERAHKERDIWLVNLKVDPIFAPLRSDNRFTQMLKRIGLAP